MMNADDLAALSADIAANGLTEKIFLADGKIADGRNRYQACVAAGVEPEYREWDGKGDLTSIVISLNLHRRHLSESQRAVVAAKLANLERGRPGENPQICGFVSQSSAAELLSVSERSVSSAKKVMRDGVPELIEKVESGEISVSRAAELAEMPKHRQKFEIKKGRKAGRKLLTKRAADALKNTDKGYIGCAHCNPEFRWTDEAIAAFALKVVYRARTSSDQQARRYIPHFEYIKDELVEDNLADETRDRYEQILNAIDAGDEKGEGIGIRERSDLQRVTGIPWLEFNQTITIMLDTGMIEAVLQGGKTDAARGARKTLYKRKQQSDGDLHYERDPDFPDEDVYYSDDW